MILYNVIKHLVDQSLGHTIVAGALTEKSAADCIAITQSGGDPEHYYDRTDWRFQVLSRASNDILAQTQCFAVYDELKNRFGLILPAKTVDSVVYPAVTTFQISPIQAPSGIGVDQANLFLWVYNFLVTTT